MQTLDIDLLRTFAALADTSSFTRTAERLHRTQSTISLQIKRLEDMLGKALFDRTSRSVRLTPEGLVLLSYAQQMLRINDEAIARVTEPDLQGVVRLGTPEDFATVYLPQVLAGFARAHPQIALEVHCDLTLNLLEAFHKGAFDLVLVKREPQWITGGVKVWREPLVWVAADRSLVDPNKPLSLILSPHPCVYRKRALTALEKAQWRWHITYTSPSLAGTQAAVIAGLGITVLPYDMVPSHLVVLGEHEKLPELDDTEIALYRADHLPKPAERLADFIIHSLEQKDLMMERDRLRMDDQVGVTELSS